MLFYADYIFSFKLFLCLYLFMRPVVCNVVYNAILEVHIGDMKHQFSAESNEESKHGWKLSQSKDIKHDHLQVGVHHLVHQCNKLVMATCRLEHILVHQHRIICLNQLIQAILHNNHLVDTPPTGTSHLSQQISKIKVMITIASHPHPSSKLLVVLQLQQIALVIITARHQLLAITNKGRAIAKMAMVGINSLGMVSHHLMINSKVILLLLATAMWLTQLKKDMLPSFGAQGDSAQGPSQPSSMGQQGYSTGQQPSPNPASYPPQGAAQPGYGLPPSSQSGYGSQPAAQYGSYGAPQPQKPSANPPALWAEPTVTQHHRRLWPAYWTARISTFPATAIWLCATRFRFPECSTIQLWCHRCSARVCTSLWCPTSWPTRLWTGASPLQQCLLW
ncbi:hypothetical protein OIU79_003652 [Salix purpurea]|uniref:Uncharacterized protein n=1 Tax=Salix purpurea TaxID=77065 RepID=A0A9Q0UMP4_SALPP|nr:hypothetical protein OIU79_003652 [Salix purpurea]